MSRLSQLPPKDLERLSAYLDRDLPPAEMAETEARLRADPDFRRSFEELRQVVVAVRAMGEVRVPRSFALREADIRRRSPSAYPALRFATALASLAFVLLAGVRLVGPLGAAAPAPLMASAPEGEMAFRAQDAVEGTLAPPMELQAEAPLPAGPTDPAAASGALEMAGTPTAAATPAQEFANCPACPANEAEVGSAATEEDLLAPSAEPGLVADELKALDDVVGSVPLFSVAQWVVGLTALLLLGLTVRARRAR